MANKIIRRLIILRVLQSFHSLGASDATVAATDAVVVSQAHSLNCMVVAGPDFKAYYVSARWPGRLNDKRVLKNSPLFDQFEGGWRPFPNAKLLGDSGYSLRNWLFPPIGGLHLSDEEIMFNTYHKSDILAF